MVKKSKITQEVKIVKGTHLTVITHPCGLVTLEWDDEQLLKEVREAIASVTVPGITVPKKIKKKVIKD